MILAAEDRAVAGIILYLVQGSPGLTIVELCRLEARPHAGPVCIQQFMEILRID